MKHILVICEALNELTRLRKYFDSEKYAVKAVTSYAAAIANLRKETPSLVLIDIGEKITGLFPFYKFMKMNLSSADTPIIVMANPAAQKALVENTDMTGTRVVGATINVENMAQAIDNALSAAPVKAGAV